MGQKLIITADLGMIKAYRLNATTQGTPHLELLDTITFEDGHRRLAEQVTDLAGRQVAPPTKRRKTLMSDDHNLRLTIKRRLVRQIARHIQHLIRNYTPDRCWLAAPKEIVHFILEELPPVMRTRVERTFARDWLKANKQKLLEHLAPALNERTLSRA